MKFFKINISNFAKQYLGVDYDFLDWVKVLLNPLSTSVDEYDLWRKNRFYLIHITSQVVSLNGYLNDRFDPVNRTIFISNGNQNAIGTWIALESETTPYFALGFVSEDQGQFISLEAESPYSIDFIVNIPLSLINQSPQIISAVNQYRLAGKSFSIVTF